MDDALVSDCGDRLFESRFGPPAYVRRARAVQDAFDALAAQCRRERDERLGMVRTRLGMLYALAGSWDAVRPFLLDDEQVILLQRLHTELTPKLREVIEPTTSPWALRRALRELAESIDRFNRLWREFLG
ncbi:MAG TPA: hypothetical protein VMS17_03965, partial [Gemmataceae bacterium]|nr:hypothetical protein [Gemmataceae bacterium]